MEHDDLVARVRELRAEGRTPKAVAKALGLTQAEVKPLIREAAESEQVEAPERPVVTCRMSPGWSAGLTFDGHPEWSAETDQAADPLDGPDGLVSVLVERRYKWGRISVCGYLVDVYCLGVKNALGPEIMTDAEGRAFGERFFGAYPRQAIDVPLELAQHLVFGAVEYARGLGFEPHRDFAQAAPYLGSLAGPSAITFGRHGRPFYNQGPDDNPRKVMATLDQAVGSGGYEFLTVVDDIRQPL